MRAVSLLISPMQSNAIHSPCATSPSPELTPAQLMELVGKQAREIENLRRQVDWLQRQIFGQKSERRISAVDGAQGVLGEGFMTIPDAPSTNQKCRVASHERESKPKRPTENGDESTLFFDEEKVPVKVIHAPNPEAANLSPEDYEIISEKASFRLAQRPGSYVVLKYVRPVSKRRDTQALSCPPAPIGVIDGSRADVSFIAGMMIDKFCYHQPLYRQHQRLRDSHIKVSRSWLTQLMQKAVTQIEPIFDAQLDSVRASRVKAIDETPMKAGLAGPGKMKTAYIWPAYGELDEICFLYYPSRSGSHAQEAFGLSQPQGGVLLSDGYEVYAQYAKKTGLTHAQCWAHARSRLRREGH
jgi:transposase